MPGPPNECVVCATGPSRIDGRSKTMKAPSFLTGLPRLQSQYIRETEALTDVIGSSDFQRSSFRASDRP
jgi:hypothetical protein